MPFNTLARNGAALLLLVTNAVALFAQDAQDTSHIYRDPSKRLIYRGRWYEPADLARISQEKGYQRAACFFNRSATCRRKSEIAVVGMLGSAVLGYMSTWQEQPARLNPIASGFLIAAGASGMASGWYAIRSKHSIQRGVRAFNRAVDIEQGRAVASEEDASNGTACKREPLLSKDENRLIKHRFSSNALSGMVVFDGKLMSIEKAAVYADDNRIAGAGDLLRELASLKNPGQGTAIGPVTLNDKAGRAYAVQKNQLNKAILRSIRQHNKEVRK